MDATPKKTVSMRLSESIVEHYQAIADKSDRSLGYILAKIVETAYQAELEKDKS